MLGLISLESLKELLSPNAVRLHYTHDGLYQTLGSECSLQAPEHLSAHFALML